MTEIIKAQEVETVPLDGVGRPTKYTPARVGKLVLAFSNDYTVVQACDYAGISKDTFYEWIKVHPEFSDQIEQAKQLPFRKSREVLMGAINEGDWRAALQFLRLRDKQYIPKGQIDVNVGLQETRSKLKEFFDDTNDGAYEVNAPHDASAELAGSDQQGSGDTLAQGIADIS